MNQSSYHKRTHRACYVDDALRNTPLGLLSAGSSSHVKKRRQSDRHRAVHLRHYELAVDRELLASGHWPPASEAKQEMKARYVPCYWHTSRRCWNILGLSLAQRTNWDRCGKRDIGRTEISQTNKRSVGIGHSCTFQLKRIACSYYVIIILTV